MLLEVNWILFQTPGVLSEFVPFSDCEYTFLRGLKTPSVGSRIQLAGGFPQS